MINNGASIDWDCWSRQRFSSVLLCGMNERCAVGYSSMQRPIVACNFSLRTHFLLIFSFRTIPAWKRISVCWPIIQLLITHNQRIQNIKCWTHLQKMTAASLWTQWLHPLPSPQNRALQWVLVTYESSGRIPLLKSIHFRIVPAINLCKSRCFCSSVTMRSNC